MQTITTTLKREWFSEIVDGSKRIEKREIKPYWADRLRAMRRRIRYIYSSQRMFDNAQT